MITAVIWRCCSRGNRHHRDPHPIINPCWIRDPMMQNQASPRNQATSKKVNRTIKTAIPHRLHEDVTAALTPWASRWLPVHWTRHCPWRRKNHWTIWSSCIGCWPAPWKLEDSVPSNADLDKAQFRELTTLEGFDWQFNAKGLDRRIIEQLATCDFVRRSQNVILVGQTGLGKSRILQAVGHAACILGVSTRSSQPRRQPASPGSRAAESGLHPFRPRCR